MSESIREGAMPAVGGEPHRCIKMRVVETITSIVSIAIPASANPEEWVETYGDEYWLECDNREEFFSSADDRYCEVA